MNYCINNNSFLETIENYWNKPYEGDNMCLFHQKIKRLANTLSSWSKREFGNIYAKVEEFEERVNNAEEDLVSNRIEENRINIHHLNAEYIKFLKLKESILKQKAQLQLFKEGYANMRYFHALIKGRRRKFFIHKVKNKEVEWVQGDKEILASACDYF